MNSKEIVARMSRWFTTEMSPGQVFDDLVSVRQQGVQWEDVVNAIRSQSVALDVDDDAPRTPNVVEPTKPWPRARKPETYACEDCGISRTRGDDSCPNPHCDSHKPKGRARPTPRPATSKLTFTNPKLSFGKYAGKTLLDIIAINPGHVKDMADGKFETLGEFWVQQAKLAQIHAAANAPAYKDTDSTGFLT